MRVTSKRLPIALAGLAVLALVPALVITQQMAAARPIGAATLGQAAPVEIVPPVGSQPFRQALELLDADKATEALAVAETLGDTAERRAIQWAAILFDAGVVDYRHVAAFAADAPDFAAASLLQSRFEAALMRSAPSDGEVLELLGEDTPSTIGAKIRLAQAHLGAGDRAAAARLAADVWIDNFLDAATERRVRSLFGALFTRDHHWRRAVHLLMNDRATGTERILSLLTPAQQSLAKARIAVSRKANDAAALLDKVAPAYRQHPLYWFSRAQLAERADRLEEAVAFLNSAKGPVPDAIEWRSLRLSLTRRLLAQGFPQLAYEAAAGFTDGPEGRLVEARFHSGWIALCFLDDPETARQHFAAMAEVSTLPDSVTQANYWLGRANLMLGDRSAALSAFGAAARFSTVYYGQLARDALGLTTVQLVETPDWQASEAQFEANDLVKAIRLFVGNGRQDMALPLLRQLGNTLTDPGELLLTARLAQSLDAHHLAISVADLAERRGARIDVANFPKEGIPADVQLASVDLAAVYAVARQESRFQVDAISRVGARGLMQLMPATARETAAKIGVGYSPSRLTSDPAYNALLGSTYLAAQLERYDGSLVLAAAAYNAGPGNANKWLRAYGDPRLAEIDPVVWVELIPLAETRNYVKRVLGNYMVYRARLDDDPVPLNEIMRQIPG